MEGRALLRRYRKKSRISSVQRFPTARCHQRWPMTSICLSQVSCLKLTVNLDCCRTRFWSSWMRISRLARISCCKRAGGKQGWRGQLPPGTAPSTSTSGPKSRAQKLRERQCVFLRVNSLVVEYLRSFASLQKSQFSFCPTLIEGLLTGRRWNSFGSLILRK